MRLESEINNHIIHKLEQERDMYKRNWDKTLKERDTLIDDIAVLKANSDRYRNRAENAMELAESENCEVLRLQNENKRLTRLTHKLTTHRTMWDNLKDWRRDMLEVDENDTQLIGLGLVMDELEHNWLYREEK